MYTTQVPIKVSNGIKVHSDKLPTYVLYSTVIMMQVPGADEVASSASASSRREDLCRSFFMCTVLLHRIPSLYCFEAMSIAQQEVSCKSQERLDKFNTQHSAIHRWKLFITTWIVSLKGEVDFGLMFITSITQVPGNCYRSEEPCQI